ncbi:MAG: glycosyltransferase family 2 protein [Flavobacteriales bacterium]
MELSIVIVNYNVRYFLEQCLQSLQQACQGIEHEVFVVDNNSKDQSCEMVKAQFPEVKLIENQDNPGFSIANNQAIKLSKGRYVLLLNPDTVVAEDSLKACLKFMDSKPDAGALGIKMINGTGEFLPESKRGLPTPKVAFYKIFGLSTLFPKSERFGKYHLSYLDKDENHEVDVLSGAFMLMNIKALEKSGLLDETFFMYGEDIDLSYRIQNAGYKNYYFSDSEIIHYKGESTKKGSINYVFVFYKAMIIFAKKHFKSTNAAWFQVAIYLAIYLRAILSLVKRAVVNFSLPVLDGLVMFFAFDYIKTYWENNHLYIKNGGLYPEFLTQYFLPAYILIWLVSLAFNGAYEKTMKFRSIFRGLFIGTICILTAYALLPEDFRTSRALILLAALCTGFWFFLSRSIIHFLGFSQEKTQKNRVLILAEANEAQRIKNLITQQDGGGVFCKTINQKYNIEQIRQLQDDYGFKTLILSDTLYSFKQIINSIEALKDTQMEFKIALEGKDFIVGSNSIHSQGEVMTSDYFAITKANNRRQKRLLDLGLSFALILTSPLLFFKINSLARFLKAMGCILIGKASFVGYPDQNQVPKLKPAYLKPAYHSESNIEKELHFLYAKDYQVEKDIKLIIKHFNKLCQL